MSFKKSFKNFISNFWGKIKANVDTEHGWFPFLNSQLKWAIGFLIRTMTLVFTLILIIMTLKHFKVVSSLRSIVVQDALNIKDEGSEVVSYPDINYTGDLKSIDDVIEMLESKKKEKNKDEKNNKKGAN